MSHTVRFGLLALPLLFILVFAPILAAQDKKLKEVQWSHAFDLACRKVGDAKFDENTKRWGVEAYRDNNALGGVGIYISQTGSIALGPNFTNLTAPIMPSKSAEHTTGLDLPTRKAGVAKFGKDTKVHSMEVFRDPNADNWLLITDQGNIAATTGKLFPGVANKSPKWVHSVDLQVRKGGVKEFKGSTKIGIEVYSDGNTGNLIYITENGAVAIIPETKEVPADKGKAPDWLHGLDLKCRKSSEKEFSENDTRKFGLEVYHDVTTGNLIFICETGSIAVMPAPSGIKAPTADTKQPRFTHGLNVKCREFGEKLFSDKTRVFGAEVFREENLDAWIYINELGNIAVMAGK